MRRRLTSLCCALGLVSVASPSYADVVKIAYVGPQTGAVTQYGNMIRDGILTAVEQVNATGGIDGHTFELMSVDDACEPKQGPIVANALVNQKIKFVIGPVCSGVALGAAPIFDEQGILMIAPSATAAEVTDGKDYRFVFRAIGRNEEQANKAAEFIAKGHYQKIAILHDKRSYGQGMARVVRDDLAKLNVPVAIFEGISVGDSDYSSLITSLKAKGVDFVYYGGYHPELGLLLRQAKEQNFRPTFMGAEGAGNLEINAIAGDAVDNLLVTLPTDFSGEPANRTVVQQFKAKGRDASGAYQLMAYAATQAIMEGIRNTHSIDPAKVADWLHANTVKSVIGDLSWKPSGDLTNFKFEVFKWHKDGTKTLVE
ncbi:high-affinity branched-chain amino acid ABC transporter substrate-binding protein [Pelistega europaea]|uniref:High-affinity branched-chain amino acid ABC transporter substrate-binding protein n=1 Tax=Pelistega europaea TaxID=106147 RepID=A0A7Y4L9Y1_9BURK|nr:high-affinity branched-chain amino acid ABC transporter substrate-binding protein [Pelistega europaea]NOL49714.1 high-affinity branched-chain amino acid ABC transporter substrate-binding protein [Pelistega europaea]